MKPTTRTKKPGTVYPHVLYLDQSGSNHLAVRDVQMDIWLMKTPREVTTERDEVDRVDLTLQDVDSRDEEWAESQYIQIGNQVSNRSHSVMHRFTGRLMVAKMFVDLNRRDEEFRMFNKPQVDASIVEYRQSTHIGGVPAVITDPYEGFQSYSSVRTTLRQLHPGLRFMAANKLLFRLFAALEFLNYQGIVHGNVSHDSVLMRIVDNRVEQVLLVNYSSAQSFSPGDIAPKETMIADGKAVIELIDDLCDLWTIRMAPTATAQNEEVMRKRTQEAAEKSATIERCLRDFIDIQGHSESSEKGKRLSELLESSKIDEERAYNDQIHNNTLKEVGNISKRALDDMRDDYVKIHGQPALGTRIIWNLSLGHPYLDGLVTRLYHQQWDFTPREICEKIREIAGDVEEPWQVFLTTLTFAFEQQAQPTDPPADQNLAALATEPIISWLAKCCEICPEWRMPLQTEFAARIRPTDLGVNRDTLSDLRRALSQYGPLPPSLHQVFEYLLGLYDKPPQDAYAIDVDYKIWFHQPSRMFNATQLHGLASPEDLRSCIAESKVTCNHYAEVRGSSELEGCYVPMVLLRNFIDSLGLTVRDLPDTSIGLPTFDPSDFSQAPHQGRIVLARPGILGYASVVRSIDQCCWRGKPKSVEEVETPTLFLPTYFGDFEVFPELPRDSRHPRPEHWAQFVTSSSVAADILALQLVGQEGASATAAPPQSGLSDLLRQRESVRAAAFRERNADETDAVEPATPRVQPEATATPRTTTFNQGQALLRSRDSETTKQNKKTSGSTSRSFSQQRSPSIGQGYDDYSTTVPDEAPVCDGDWDKVEQWLAEEAKKKSSQHLFNFRLGQDSAGSETEPGTSSTPSRSSRLRNSE
jgi:hypothetical protein